MKEVITMADIINNAVLAGNGLTSLTHEKAEEFAKELIKRGELSENEKSKFVKEALDQSEKAKTEIGEKIEKTVETIVSKMNIPTRIEFDELKGMVEELSRKTNKTE
jgi:polyhydroxyalkanoate synthesis regulator phasin